MNNVKVRKIRKNARIPERASNGAIGFDVYASIVLNKITKEIIGELPIEIEPGESVLIGIGVQLAIPWPYEAQVRPRSGLACKHDIELSNSPGTIDPDFRGEAGVLLRNRGKKPFMVEEGMRIAQLIFSGVEIPVLEESEYLPKTLRGAGGFGSTGLFEIKEGTTEYRKQITEKDKFYMTIVQLAAEHSFEGAACLIVKDSNIISMGKKGIICAEMQALSNLVATGGTSSRGADMYLNTAPCDICSKLIVQSGIENVILSEEVSAIGGISILKEAGVSVRKL
ncbi:MAG: dUTP diphosphatase [Candidatus Omnitrophica bacterium]|nr:dUTP diphosphatase [Candidatus Omnitrophota bacterium]